MDEVGSKILLASHWVRTGSAFSKGLGQQITRTERVVDPLASNWIGEARGITHEGPSLARNSVGLKRFGPERRNQGTVYGPGRRLMWIVHLTCLLEKGMEELLHR